MGKLDCVTACKILVMWSCPNQYGYLVQSQFQDTSTTTCLKGWAIELNLYQTQEKVTFSQEDFPAFLKKGFDTNIAIFVVREKIDCRCF